MKIINEPTLQMGKQSSKRSCVTSLPSQPAMNWAWILPTPKGEGVWPHVLGLNGARQSKPAGLTQNPKLHPGQALPVHPSTPSPSPEVA